MATSESTGGGMFGKAGKKEEKEKSPVAAVPVGRLVASPRRQLGRGTRDTILNGSDGIAS